MSISPSSRPSTATRGPDLGGDLRFLTESQHGELDWNFLPYDRSFDGSRNRVRFTDVADLADFWRLTLHAEEVSDPFYFEDFSQGPEGTSTAFLERSATFSYRDEHWRIDGQAQQFQTIDYTLPVDDRPYARLPRVAARSDYNLGGIFHYGFDSELVDFQRPGGTLEVSGWRADVTPGVYLDLAGPGYFVRPALAWRATQYELQYTLPGEPRSPSRTLPIASFDTGLMFERSSGSHDQRRLTLEPRLLYLKVPYRDQQDLPVFDTALPDLLNPVELFRNNRFVGADRQSDANQVTVGVTSRLLDAQNGRQFISGTFGQTYSFEAPRVLLPGEVPGSEKRSNLVAQLALTAFQDWSAAVGLLWDPQRQGSERSTAQPAVQARQQLGHQPRVPLRALHFRPDRGLGRLAHTAQLERVRPRNLLAERSRIQPAGGPARGAADRRPGIGAAGRLPGAFRRVRVSCVLLAGAARRAPLRQQSQRDPGHGGLAAAGTRGPGQCRIGDGHFPWAGDSRLRAARGND